MMEKEWAEISDIEFLFFENELILRFLKCIEKKIVVKNVSENNNLLY